MASKILAVLSDFFDLDGGNEENETIDNSIIEEDVQEHTERPIELGVVISFVRELESYYTNEIFKAKSAYINNSISDDALNFLKKKIKEYEFSTELITGIKEDLIKKERECKELWGKASYSFYNELENAKSKSTFMEAFKIVKKLASINVIVELDEIIRRRLESYKKSWNIIGEDIPKNTSLRIVDRKINIETYQFGDFKKDIIDIDSTKDLLPEQINAIKELKVQIEFENPESNNIWIRCTTISRKQLEYLKKTTFFQNDWEDGMNNEIVYDIVDIKDVEYYIRAMLQLLLPRKSYVIISVINPNEEMIRKINNSVEIDEQSKQVRIVDKMAFLLPERMGVYKDNLKIEYVNRRDNLKELVFTSFKDFTSKFI